MEYNMCVLILFYILKTGKEFFLLKNITLHKFFLNLRYTHVNIAMVLFPDSTKFQGMSCGYPQDILRK